MSRRNFLGWLGKAAAVAPLAPQVLGATTKSAAASQTNYLIVRPFTPFHDNYYVIDLLKAAPTDGTALANGLMHFQTPWYNVVLPQEGTPIADEIKRLVTLTNGTDKVAKKAAAQSINAFNQLCDTSNAALLSVDDLKKEYNKQYSKIKEQEAYANASRDTSYSRFDHAGGSEDEGYSLTAESLLRPLRCYHG